MIKKILCLVVASVFGLSIASGDEKVGLAHELDEFMTLKPIPDKYFENNLYVGWMGFLYPRDNWISAYSDLFKRNDEILNQRVNSGYGIAQRVADVRIARLLNSMADQDDFDNMSLIELGIRSLDDHIRQNERVLAFRQVPYQNEKYVSTMSFFPCEKYLNEQCIRETNDRRTYIESLAISNQELLTRFRTLVESSNYNYALYYNDHNASAIMNPRAQMGRIYQLNLSDAIVKIVNGDVDEGLYYLSLARKWIDINYYSESKPTVIQLVMNILYTQLLDQTMDGLLSSGALSEHLDDEKLQYIIGLYSDNIGESINTALLWEMSQKFKNFYYPYVKVYTQEYGENALTEEDEYIILNYLKNRGTFLPPMLVHRHAELQKNINIDQWVRYSQLEKIIDQIRNTSLDNSWLSSGVTIKQLENLERKRQEYTEQVGRYENWYAQYFFELGIGTKEALSYLNMTYASNDFYTGFYDALKILNNDKGHLWSEKSLKKLLFEHINVDDFLLLQFLIPESSFYEYWQRTYEQQNYHRLVYLKYLIMKERVLAKNIPEFLKSQKSSAINTLTGDLYQMDLQDMTLMTPLSEDLKFWPVNIRKEYLDDRSINQLKVKIPQDLNPK